jgi:hypothetical protein
MSEFNSDDYLEQRQKQTKIIANFSQVKLLLILAVIGIFIYIAWYAYTSTDDIDDSSLPIIQANSEIIKTKPENPGGLVVANRDKSIYEGMSSAPAKKAKTEKTVTPPEAPASKQVVVEKIEKNLPVVSEKQDNVNSVPVQDFIVSKNEEKQELPIQPEEASETHSEQVSEIVEPSVPDAQEKVLPPVTSNAIVKADHVHEPEISELDKELDDIKPNVNTKKTENIIQPDSKTGSELKSGGLRLPRTYTIRIAALKTEQATIEAWKSLKSNYNDLLGNLNSEVRVAEKDGKKIYYLHAGPVSSQLQAEQICKSLQEQGRRCRVY